jgi:NAD(P)-dependent dehydrogenase (short-subunit alcohol dehydrogenase family)
VIAYLDEHDDAKETAKWVEHAGRRVVRVPGDVGDERQCQTLVEAALREFGRRAQGLLNNRASRGFASTRT